jgi:hypothetical protein
MVRRYELTPHTRGYESYESMDENADGDWVHHEDYARLAARVGEMEREREHLLQQAQIQAQEMRTQRAIVRDCYQAATGATGEPGDWNGAEPIRALVRDRDALAAKLAQHREALTPFSDLAADMHEEDSGNLMVYVRLGDCRRARDVMEWKDAR